jgi:hypothetical protein
MGAFCLVRVTLVVQQTQEAPILHRFSGGGRALAELGAKEAYRKIEGHLGTTGLRVATESPT